MSESGIDQLTVVDLFAGAGGLSTGVAQACESLGLTPGDDVQLHAINHWAPAIETHERNHPWADHYHAKIEELHPPDVVTPGEVDLLTGGPECTHFSTARGGKPVSEQKRASAWHVLDWVEKLRPTHILLENVSEFRDWGPIVDGEPTRDGSIFQRWVGMLEAFGYSVVYDDGANDYGVVCNAADFGDPQSRERLFIMASRETRPTPPEPTHDDADPGKPDRRPAADIIDWSDLGSSIWTRDLENARVQPLSENTMRRIAEGIRRHCDDRLAPFADALAELGPDRLEQLRNRVVSAADAPTVAAALNEPFLVRHAAPASGEAFCLRQQSGGVPARLDAPLPTISTKGAISLATAYSRPLIKPRNGSRGDLHSNALYRPEERPSHVVTAKNHDGHLVTPTLIHYSHGGALRDVDAPLPTVATEKGGAFALSRPYLCPMYNGRARQRPRTRALDRPLSTIPASKSPAGLASPALVKYYGTSTAVSVDEPLDTVTANGRGGGTFGLMAPYLVAYYGNSSTQPVDEPLPTVTTRDRYALCVPEAWPWGLDVRYRMLQPRELKQAQGFPDNYELAGETKRDITEQIGNAVPVGLARALVRHLLIEQTPSLSSFGAGLQDTDASVPAYEEVTAADD